MLTDDPDTPGDGRWEINTAYTGLRTNAERVHSFPHVDFNYGLGDQIQLKYETGWIFTHPADEGRKSGLDNSLVGLKWRFLDYGDDGPKASIYPQIEFDNGTGSEARGIAEPSPNFLLPFEVSRSFGPVHLVGELGYEFLRDAEDQWIYGLLGAAEVSEKLELLAELHGTTSRHFGNPDSVVNLGLRRSLGQRFRLLASAGTGLRGSAENTRFIAYLGIQLLLEKEKP